jgi:hypothetical protein
MTLAEGNIGGFTSADCAFAVPTLCASVLLDLLRATGSAAPAPGDGHRWALAGPISQTFGPPQSATEPTGGSDADGAESDTEAPVDEAFDAAAALDATASQCAQVCRERLARGIWAALQRGEGAHASVVTVLQRRLLSALASLAGSAAASSTEGPVPLAIAVDTACALARPKPPAAAANTAATATAVPAVASAPAATVVAGMNPPAGRITIAELRRARELQQQQQQSQQQQGVDGVGAALATGAAAPMTPDPPSAASATGAECPLAEDPGRLRPGDAKRLARDLSLRFMDLLGHVPRDTPPRLDWRRAALTALVRQQRREGMWAGVICPTVSCAAATATPSPKPRDGWAATADASAPASTRAALELVERAMFGSLQEQQRMDAALIARRNALVHSVCAPLAAGGAGTLPLAEVVVLCDAQDVQRRLHSASLAGASPCRVPRWVALCVLPLRLDGAVTLPPQGGPGHPAGGLLGELEGLAQAFADSAMDAPAAADTTTAATVSAPSTLGVPSPEGALPWVVPRGVAGGPLKQRDTPSGDPSVTRALLTLDGPFAAWASTHA